MYWGRFATCKGLFGSVPGLFYTKLMVFRPNEWGGNEGKTLRGTETSEPTRGRNTHSCGNEGKTLRGTETLDGAVAGVRADDVEMKVRPYGVLKHYPANDHGPIAGVEMKVRPYGVLKLLLLPPAPQQLHLCGNEGKTLRGTETCATAAGRPPSRGWK